MGPLTLIGSAETSPGMVRVHRTILDSLPPDPRIVYVDTPHGFQENADSLSEKVADYFRISLNQNLEVASFRQAGTTSLADAEAFKMAIEGADYVFAGPGSPSYAISQWQQIDAVRSMALASSGGAAITLASAAAVTAGRYAIPVYEIYKAGQAPFWLDGIDLLSAVTGIRAVVVPHWDNQDGENHDTRHCYIGRRRLDELIGQLPESLPIIGIDEHTAVTLANGTITVAGRGGLTLLQTGHEEIIPAGESVDIDSLFPTGIEVPRRPEPTPTPPAFEASLAAGNTLEAANAVLEILPQADSAPARRMIVKLARTIENGRSDDLLDRFVQLLVDARERARLRNDYDEADQIRGALVEAGVEIQDEPGASHWSFRA